MAAYINNIDGSPIEGPGSNMGGTPLHMMGSKGWVCWISVPEGLMTLGINHGYEGRKDMSSLSTSARQLVGFWETIRDSDSRLLFVISATCRQWSDESQEDSTSNVS